MNCHSTTTLGTISVDTTNVAALKIAYGAQRHSRVFVIIFSSPSIVSALLVPLFLLQWCQHLPKQSALVPLDGHGVRHKTVVYAPVLLVAVHLWPILHFPKVPEHASLALPFIHMRIGNGPKFATYKCNCAAGFGWNHIRKRCYNTTYYYVYWLIHIH